jgi:CelD/BcsL family acetyltransferase involved in cellulose biosynthesis
MQKGLGNGVYLLFHMKRMRFLSHDRPTALARVESKKLVDGLFSKIAHDGEVTLFGPFCHHHLS